MQEAFEKIKERLEKLKEYEANGDCPKDGMCTKKPYECTSCYSSTAIEIVNQVAEEYGTDINVGDSWKTVYDKVLELEKEYAMSGAIENVNDCIRLENLLQYFKEELREEYNQSLANNNQSLTNDGWIPCSERLPEEEYDTVLTVTDRNHYCVAVYTTEHGFRTMDIDCVGDFIAWQPLPEPYRGE